MDDNKFFKLIWRFNALVIFVGASALAVFALIALVLAISDSRNKATPPPVAEVPSNPNDVEEKFRIQIPHSSSQTGRYTYFEMRSGVDSYGKFSSGSNSQMRNLAIYDLKTDAIKWVFETAQQEIEAYKPVVKSIKSGDGKTISVKQGFLITVATSRTDGTIARDLWVMKPDGQDFRKILSNITGRVDVKKYGGEVSKLLLVTDETIDVYAFDINALTIGAPVTVSLP